MALCQLTNSPTLSKNMPSERALLKVPPIKGPLKMYIARKEKQSTQKTK